jgi:hypothetical protein
LYVLGGNSATFIGTTGTTWVSSTTTPSAGHASVAWDGVSAYRIYNNIGSSETFGVAAIATRNAT